MAINFTHVSVKATPTPADPGTQFTLEIKFKNTGTEEPEIGIEVVVKKPDGSKDYLPVFMARVPAGFTFTHTAKKVYSDPGKYGLGYNVSSYKYGEIWTQYLSYGPVGDVFEIIGPPPPPPPPPPAPRRIIGKVTHSVLGTPLALAKITFGDKSVNSGSDGNYEMRDPAEISGPITCELPGFETVEDMITAPVEGDLIHNFSLTPVAPPPPPVPGFPEMPPDFPSHLIPYWNRLRDAYETKDKAAMLEVLRELIPLKASPAASLMVLFAILGIVSVITATIGSYPFAKFIIEESLQTIDLAVFQAMNFKQWDLAAVALAEKEGFLDVIDKPVFMEEVLSGDIPKDAPATTTILDFLKTFFFSLRPGEWVSKLIKIVRPEELPYANTVVALKHFIRMSRAKLEIDKELISREVSAVQEWTAYDFDKAVEAIKGGEDPAAYLPVPSLPWTTVNEIETLKSGIDDKYWVVKNYIDAADKDAATRANVVYLSSINGFKSWIDDKIDPLVKSRAYTNLVDYWNSEMSKHSALATLIDKIVPEEELLTGTLNLIVEPADAIITVAGHPEITMPGSYVLDVGPYRINVSKEGFYPASATAIIKPEPPTKVSIALTEKPPEPPPEPEKATLEINSIPPGAKVYIDGEYKFTLTPYTTKLDPGTYTIRLELHGHIPSEESITLEEGEERTYLAELEPEEVPPPLKSILEIASNVPASDVYIDGEKVGITPFKKEMDPGTYHILVTKFKYNSEEGSVKLEPGETKTISVEIEYVGEEKEPVEPEEYNAWKYTLWTIDEETGASINAKVFIDGVDTEKWTPCFFYLEPLTTYSIWFEAFGYESMRITVTTEALPTPT